jgi:hypothetical protein
MRCSGKSGFVAEIGAAGAGDRGQGVPRQGLVERGAGCASTRESTYQTAIAAPEPGAETIKEN